MTVHYLGIEGNITDQGQNLVHFIGELPAFPDDVIREQIRREYAEEVRMLTCEANQAKEEVRMLTCEANQAKAETYTLRANLNVLRSRNLWQRILNR